MVKKGPKNYIPDRGDLVWLEFNPQTGHEQAGKRPALIISPLAYNRVVGLALLCPVTSKVKNYPFEVKLPEKSKIQGVILSDQVKSLDWQMRKVSFIEKVRKDILEEVIEKLLVLIK